MKRIKKALPFLILLITFFILAPLNISAKTVLMTCEYKYDPGQLSFWRTIKVDIYTDYSHQAYLSKQGGSQNNKEDVQNWTKAYSGTSFIAKNYIQNNNKCPDQALFYESKTVGAWQVFLGDEATLQKISNDKTKDGHNTWFCNLPPEKNDEYFKKLNDQLLDRAKTLNEMYDNFFANKCNESNLGVSSNDSCKSLKQSIINVANNNAIYDRDKAISEGLDPKSTGVVAINDFLNKMNTILVPTEVGEEIENLTCNYKATIDSKDVTLTVYKKRKLPGDTYFTFTVSITADNGYNIKYGKYSDYALLKYDYSHELGSSVIGSMSKWECLPEIAYDVDGNTIDLFSDNLAKTLSNNGTWDKYFKLSSLSTQSSKGTTTYKIGDANKPKIFDNAISSNDPAKTWIFGGSNYNYNTDPHRSNVPGASGGPDVDVDITEGCGLISQELEDWINGLLNIIKIGAIAVTVILTMLDFAKAAALGEAETMKKTWSKLIKRLVIVLILFILPIVIDFILGIISINGVDPNNPTCGIK